MLETVMSTVSATLSTVPSLTIREKVKVTGVFEVSAVSYTHLTLPTTPYV